jgi:hypothetical protein
MAVLRNKPGAQYLVSANDRSKALFQDSGVELTLKMNHVVQMVSGTLGIQLAQEPHTFLSIGQWDWTGVFSYRDGVCPRQAVQVAAKPPL